MSQRVSDRAYAGSRRRGSARRHRPWLRRILLLFIGIVFVLPVCLILLFRFVAPPSPCGYLPDQVWRLEYEQVASLSPAEYLERMQQTGLSRNPKAVQPLSALLQKK